MIPDSNSSGPPNLLVADLAQSNSWNFPVAPVPTTPRIKIPPLAGHGMAPRNTRNSAGHRNSATSHTSGSEYHGSVASADADEPVKEEEPIAVFTTTQRGRKTVKKNYAESQSEEDPLMQDDVDPIDLIGPDDSQHIANGHQVDHDDDDDDEPPARRQTRSQQKKPIIVMSDEDEEPSSGRRLRKRRDSPPKPKPKSNGRNLRSSKHSSSRVTRRSTRSTRSRAPEHNDDDVDYVHHSSTSADGDGSTDDVLETSPEPEVEEDKEGDEGEGQDVDGKPYALRQRREVNYYVPPALEDLGAPPPKPKSGGKANGRGTRPANRRKGPGWSATGAELSRWMGGGDDSDSDHATRTPGKQPFGVGAGGGGVFAGGAAGTGLFPGDLAGAAGTPSNLGKVGDASLADVDPLGVNQNISFDDVGGLEEHISQLREMTLLPLLYPDLFKNLNITPPRGVLFHGPPGTGKTLLARALAASTRHDGKGVSFFMRKGADCLSKWVGEAERQLRLLFEEAKNQQPSIIFFDEIDGLAPVRSSKQDQIHASIVSTLLALMDGMDGRGQVIVIGATNRPDAIDPALRRPGRFDREFYFPLPSFEAREKILSIMTKKWTGWETDQGEENCRGLAKLTKGYGGADLRALCTEAALNAIQRRYPQIYRSNDRLLLDPDSIQVQLRDFMVSIKKLVPSSARAAAPEAAPLPSQLVPLLSNALQRVTDVIESVMPKNKRRTALEEAEYEDDGDEGALDREMMLQSMETLRVYRPRVVVHGPPGMGQRYIAAAALHHLEGYHVQSLDLGTLMSDSTRTLEAAIIQLFMEAKRHQPSVIYIPSLNSWSSAVSEAGRSTVRSMLDSLGPSDPILLLALVDGSYQSLPKDVKSWFGPTRQNRAELIPPTIKQREEFFQTLVNDIRRPPTQFPDGVQRKKRVLEELPIAPPLEPRAPTAAELAVQEANDQRVITLLKFRLGPILAELKRKFRRFTKRASEEYNMEIPIRTPQPTIVELAEPVLPVVEVQTNADGEAMDVVNEEGVQEVVEQTADAPNGIEVPHLQAQAQLQMPEMFHMDLELMHTELYKSKYLTPDDFLDDIRKIVHNATVFGDIDSERLYRAQAMYTAAEVSLQDFDYQFRMDCQRMAVRERKRRDEFRMEKEKEKERVRAAEAESARNSAEAPARRSTRANGLEPDFQITDPVRLERSLKRQRSAEANADRSEEEGPTKRSRVSSQEIEQQHVNGISIAGPSTPHRGPSQQVRWADDPDGDGEEDTPSSPSPNNGQPIPPLPLPRIETPRGPIGFDSLLNPKSSPEEPRAADNALTHLTTIVIDHPPSEQAMSVDSNPQLDLQEPSSSSQQLQTPIAEVPTDVPPHPEQPLPSGDAEDIIMQPERTPTPPPSFELDEPVLLDLAEDLRSKTDRFNVEQLEQLRASCLNRIWKHRSKWDRTPLVKELREVVEEFVQDVTEYEMDNDEVS
ncbi:hypothetical protein QCA50_006204 [Cerrena zonata]|uniref:AAA+ ATPase domain-containing protein n=1 Tax=Cerrena zonata TaxID=2478898 RepID=A0AAW0GCL1_9APHY